MWSVREEQSAIFSPIMLIFLGSLSLKVLLLYLQYPINYIYIVSINIIEMILFFITIFHSHKQINTKIIPIVFVFSSFLYTSGPTLFYIFAPKFALFFNNTQLLSSLYNSIFFSSFSFLILFIFNKNFCRMLYEDFYYDLELVDKSAARGVISFVFAAAITYYYINNFYQSGISDSVASASRFEITQKVETGRIWLLQYAMSAYMMWFIIYFYKTKNISNPIYYIIILANLITLSVYFYYYIQLGNRREITSVAIFFFIISYIIKSKIPYSLFLLVPAGLIYVGISRVVVDGGATLSIDDAVFAALGEFVLTSFPLNIYIEMGMKDFEYGATVLKSIMAGTPLIDINSKPLSLANEFVQFFSFNGIGYGFSPMAEGFLNFGFSGAIFGSAMLVATIGAIARIRIPFRSFGLILTASLALDIFRGESGSIFWQLLVMYSVFCALTVVVRMRSFGRA